MRRISRLLPKGMPVFNCMKKSVNYCFMPFENTLSMTDSGKRKCGE